jgi:Adenomatous polyposis coli tumour suppressor protein
MCLLKTQTRGSGPGVNHNHANGLGELSINTNMGKLHEGKPQRPPSAPILDLENPKSQWNMNNTATVRPNNVMSAQQRTLSMPQLNPEAELEINTEPQFLLYGPPKPPRTSLVLERASNNLHMDRLDKAEIRNALQNWQMGQLMNDNEQKLAFNSRFARGPGDGQHQEFGNGPNGIYQKRGNNRRREPRRHTLQNGIDYNMLKRLKQIEEEKDVLLQGLSAVEKSREWYLKQIGIVQDKIRYMGRVGGSHMVSEAICHTQPLQVSYNILYTKRK